MRKLFGIIVTVVLAAVLLAGCMGGMTKKQLSKTLGVDLSGGKVLQSEDTHGGFLGDDVTFITLSFADGELPAQLREGERWHELPLSENVTALLWGIETPSSLYGPYIADQNGDPLFPVVENGFWFFIDRQNTGADIYDDSQVLDRYSFNITVAIYDSETGMLYYCEFDT